MLQCNTSGSQKNSLQIGPEALRSAWHFPSAAISQLQQTRSSQKRLLTKRQWTWEGNCHGAHTRAASRKACYTAGACAGVAAL